jgi:predicted  nucleic acid-binding Zn-ribbon protein
LKGEKKMSNLLSALDDLNDSFAAVKECAEEAADDLELVEEDLDKYKTFVNDLHYSITELLKVYKKKAFTKLLTLEEEELISKINDWESQISDFLDEV